MIMGRTRRNFEPKYPKTVKKTNPSAVDSFTRLMASTCDTIAISCLVMDPIRGVIAVNDSSPLSHAALSRFRMAGTILNA